MPWGRFHGDREESAMFQFNDNLKIVKSLTIDWEKRSTVTPRARLILSNLKGLQQEFHGHSFRGRAEDSQRSNC